MTCICGVIQGRRVYLAGDSYLAGNSEERSTAVIPKVWANPAGWIAGYYGDYQLGTRLVFNLDIPKPPVRDADLDKWATMEIPSAMEIALRDIAFGLADPTEEQAEPNELGVLIGLRGRIYFYEYPHIVTRSPWSYSAGGSGAMPALGSLCETGKLLPKIRLKRALEASERHTNVVRRPFVYVSTP